MTWSEWVAFHAAAFGHSRPDDLQMLAIWARSFQAGGYSPEELAAATEWIVGNVPMKFRTDALAALQQRVRAEREKAISRKDDDRPPEVECKLCYGVGWAMVPDPVSIRSSRYSEIVACCRCPLGRWRTGSGDPRPSVDLWDHHMPDWLERRRAHEEQVRLESEADTAAASLDNVFGQILERLKGQRS